MDQYDKRRACILVKAYPQRSQKYEETVCVAAVTQSHELLRLYPIRYRHLPEHLRFTRFDWIEAEMTRAREDARPESHRIKEDTLAIVVRGDSLTPEEKVRLWKPCVVGSMDQLEEEQRTTGRSLGIIKPDAGSVRFTWELLGGASEEAQATTKSIYVQQSLIEPELKALPTPEYVFRYKFTCDGAKHEMQLHDWEVERTYHAYKRRYGPSTEALAKMAEYYERRAPAMNLHLIMGTMQKRFYQFIVIGVLRTTADIERADAQIALL